MGRSRRGRKDLHITLPPGVIDELDRAAQGRGYDRSQLIQEICEAYLKQWRAEQAEKPGGSGKTG
jgi:metal-responsive CopG/Arc/MetJ family transcriptional regulator